MLENDYKYELKYIYKDRVCTLTFSGEVTFDQLISNLQNFLYSCGWSEDTVKEHIKTEEDMWEETEDNKETDNSKREDLKPEYYKTPINCGEYKNNINYYDHNYKYDINNDYYQYDGNEPYHGYEFNDNKD